MFVVAMKTTRTRLTVWGMALMALVAILLASVRSQPTVVATLAGGDTGRVALLRQMGYEPSARWSEVQAVALPAQLDPEWTAYQELQKACGYDLVPYLGERVKCYTYPVGQGGQAHLYEYEGKVIAGDIVVGDQQTGLIPKKQGEANGATG